MCYVGKTLHIMKKIRYMLISFLMENDQIVYIALIPQINYANYMGVTLSI